MSDKSWQELRRKFLKTGAIALSFGSGTLAWLTPSLARAPFTGGNLREAPIELAGDWSDMRAEDVMRVLTLSRSTCLHGIVLGSDQQPRRLRVEARAIENPVIWLHDSDAALAWACVTIDSHHWAQLAYQFGHELGHVLANSWQVTSKPRLPCQWLEEALMEAFTLRGLALLADRWAAVPPFANDHAYGAAIVAYRDGLTRKRRAQAQDQSAREDFRGWFLNHGKSLSQALHLNDEAYVVSFVLLEMFERDPTLVEAIGALNRWPGRSAVSLPAYLENWQTSCQQIGINAALPARLRQLII